MQADRDGRHMEFAEAYEASACKKEALREAEKYMNSSDEITEETMKELSVQRATTNGFFFTLKTLIKVRATTIGLARPLQVPRQDWMTGLHSGGC